MNLLDLMVKIGVDDKATARIGAIGNSIKSGLGTAAKAGAVAIGAAVTAAAAGTAALGKAALDSYASYEQLSGGVNKLFGDQAGAQLMQYAQNAYKTAGMSANQYMEQATSFSASLIQSLGGDTEQAAYLADVAMRAMSDNVNVFGSDMESVQNAFQGFAKGNYTMLDNLKLGYGGTKEEMERLIADAAQCADAQEALGLSVDGTSMSFDNIVKAIQVMQYEQGIAGTTAKEAGTTIEGTVNSMKAAWANLLTEIGKPEADIGARMKEMVETVFGDGTENNLGVFGTVMPAISNIVSNAALALTEAMPYIQTALSTYLPMVLESIVQLTPQVLEILVQVVTLLAEQIPLLVETLVPVIIELAPVLLEAAFKMFLGILDGLAKSSPEIVSGLMQMLGRMAELIIQYTPQILNAAVMLIGGIILGIVQGIAPSMEKMNEMMEGLLTTIGNFFMGMFNAGAQLINEIIQGMGQTGANMASFFGSILNNAYQTVVNFVGWFYNAGVQVINGLINGIANNFWAVIDTVLGGLQNVVNSALHYLGIASPSKLFAWMGEMNMEGMAQGIEDTADKAEKAMRNAAEGIYGAAEGEVSLGVSANTATAQSGLMAEINGLREDMRNMVLTLNIDGRAFAQATVGEMDAALSNRVARTVYA